MLYKIKIYYYNKKNLTWFFADETKCAIGILFSSDECKNYSFLHRVWRKNLKFYIQNITQFYNENYKTKKLKETLGFFIRGRHGSQPIIN